MAPLDLAGLRSAVQDSAQVKTRAIDLHANAHDASHFLLIPQAVVTAGNAAEVGGLLRASAAQGVPLTFRSGGTSLSGQAVTDGVLVDVRRNFRDIEVLDDGARVRVQPGVTVRALNARLARYGRKFGPDPASEAACTIGGVVANNSSGMNCGTVDNTYRTLESLTVVLPSGTVIDTGAADADQKLRALEPELYEGLARLPERVRNNADSVRQDPAAVLHEEHHGLRAELPAGLPDPGGHHGPPDRRQRRHAGFRGRSGVPHHPAAPARGDGPAGVPGPRGRQRGPARPRRNRSRHH